MGEANLELLPCLRTKRGVVIVKGKGMMLLFAKPRLPLLVFLALVYFYLFIFFVHFLACPKVIERIRFLVLPINRPRDHVRGSGNATVEADICRPEEQARSERCEYAMARALREDRRYHERESNPLRTMLGPTAMYLLRSTGKRREVL